MQTRPYEPARSLRNLYFVRTVFQLIWAAAVLSTALTHPRFAAVLLILYPVWDVACTLHDLRTSSPTASARTSQFINTLLGSATALGIALTVFSKPAYSIAIFGVWALAAGLLQLVSGLVRRKQLGGQWAMILSGAQSTAAGAAFVFGGLRGKFHTKDLAGYAIFGAIYFLIGGILLSRKLSQISAAQGGAIALGLLCLIATPVARAQAREARNVVVVHGAFESADSSDRSCWLKETVGTEHLIADQTYCRGESEICPFNTGNWTENLLPVTASDFAAIDPE
ncbi:DUF308 domain-containing protein [Edaphobacter sp. HDX4]|uniref:DUF308 domain-containing protein n=1 Tax=Edaphobacter sp. HDX4 TaxID=2794064 RepID=UPI002FE5F369